MKKIITSSIIFVLLFNFIFCNNCVYAEDPDSEESDSTYTESAPVSDGAAGEILESGTVSQKQGSSSKQSLGMGDIGVSALGMVTGLIALLIDILIIQVDVVLSVISAGEETTETDTETKFWLSIDRLVFNRVALVNIDYFDIGSSSDTYSVGDTDITKNETNKAIKEGIVNVFIICRALALILGVLVLIYIGIRMAISTVASEQAKYKKMLISWVESIIILFCLVYIMVFIISLAESITTIFYNLRNELIDSGQGFGVFEDTVREQIWESIFSFSGLQLTIWSIIYWVLLFSEIKFFWLYLKRLLMVGLLIAVSPLITISYSIDKAGDGSAQVFTNWMTEFIVNVFIQPIHALIYMIFVLTANTIATQAPIVALALLMAMGSVEKMIKKVFSLENLVTLAGVDKFLKKE